MSRGEPVTKEKIVAEIMAELVLLIMSNSEHATDRFYDRLPEILGPVFDELDFLRSVKG